MDYYERNKKKELTYKWDQQQWKRDKTREYVNSIKQSSSCADCSYDDPKALTFEHVREEKNMNVSQRVNPGYSIPAIQKEIDKTDVVCGNCHIKREKIYLHLPIMVYLSPMQEIY